MRSTSLTLGTLATLALASVSLAACAGDDGDGNPGDPDAAIDSTTAIDAPMSTNAIGQACTGMGQGNCPTGYECLTLQGGSGSWCSKTCADPQDPSCADGYTGVGFPACVFRVTPAGGGTPQNYCAIICEDLPGTPNICEPGECTGACPAPLMCNANLTSEPNGMGMLLARACR